MKVLNQMKRQLHVKEQERKEKLILKKKIAVPTAMMNVMTMSENSARPVTNLQRGYGYYVTVVMNGFIANVLG